MNGIPLPSAIKSLCFEVPGIDVKDAPYPVAAVCIISSDESGSNMSRIEDEVYLDE
jgi:hypothetical protein